LIKSRLFLFSLHLASTHLGQGGFVYGLILGYNRAMKSIFSLEFPKLNQVVLIIIFADFMITTAAGLVIPVMALFFVEDIPGATASTVGFAIALYWIIKSILQIPIARWLDRNYGEMDDYYAMLLGIFIVTVGAFLYYFAREVWHIYALQVLIAVGDSFATPPFYAIFTRHIDKNNEGFEWALRSSFSFGMGSAIGGVLSAILVGVIGVRSLFLVNGFLMLLGFIIMLFLKPYILPKVQSVGQGIIMEQKRL